MLRVVVADDEARVCQLILMLADWDSLGMEVVGTAGNGLEALELAERLHPDILVTDIRMPGCHGLELIQRAKEKFPQLEIVIISGYAKPTGRPWTSSGSACPWTCWAGGWRRSPKRCCGTPTAFAPSRGCSRRCC